MEYAITTTQRDIFDVRVDVQPAISDEQVAQIGKILTRKFDTSMPACTEMVGNGDESTQFDVFTRNAIMLGRIVDPNYGLHAGSVAYRVGEALAADSQDSFTVKVNR